ncbi:MAG: hypothetical protein Q7R87_00585 [Nanoarchaeota archaeon]|nr:hypothetical protein [Nanoarchaeota archaeon]
MGFGKYLAPIIASTGLLASVGCSTPKGVLAFRPTEIISPIYSSESENTVGHVIYLKDGSVAPLNKVKQNDRFSGNEYRDSREIGFRPLEINVLRIPLPERR